MYGTVAQDGAGRFAAGSRIRTSPVTRWAAPLAHTHNSVYCLPEGAGCFCDLPATLQPAIDSLGIEPAEAAVMLRNAFMQPAHALPETACFGVPVMRTAGQGNSPVVMARHIAELPFYSFWRDSSIGSAQSLIDGQAAVFLHDWNAFCRRFVRTGKHRGQTGHTDNQAVDGQYSYFGLPIVHTSGQDNASAVSEADIAHLLAHRLRFQCAPVSRRHTRCVPCRLGSLLPTVGIDRQIGRQKVQAAFYRPNPVSDGL